MHNKVFVDTSIFVAKQFDFEGELFRTLIDHAQAERVEILLPEITLREVRAKADEMVDEGIQALHRAASKAPVLRSLGPPYTEIAAQFDMVGAKAKIQANIDAFLANGKVKVLPVPPECLNSVFDDYFARQAPFGEGKKKAEFPDAFAVATLKKWIAANNEDVMVISGDGDLASACRADQRLHHEPRLEKYLQEVGEFHAAVLAYVVNLTKKHEEEVKGEVERRFGDLGFWLEDQDGDVENIDVHSVTINDIFVIKIEGEVATFELTATVSFACDLHYDDMNTAVYDSEDKRLIVLNRISETVERDEQIPVELHVAFDLGDEEHFDIVDMKLNQGKDIGVVQDDDYPYK